MIRRDTVVSCLLACIQGDRTQIFLVAWILISFLELMVEQHSLMIYILLIKMSIIFVQLTDKDFKVQYHIKEGDSELGPGIQEIEDY